MSGSSTGEYWNHGIGRLGEQDLHDWAGENGFKVIYGASGSQRTPRGTPFRVHQPTTKGLDAIFFRPHDGQVLIVDNKAGADTGSISDVGAFTSGLRAKLSDRIKKIELSKPGMSKQMAAHADKTIGSLRRAELSLKGGGVSWPANVAVAVSNFRGAAPGVSSTLVNNLRGMGIKNVVFIDARGPQTRQVWLSRSAVRGSLRRVSSLARLGMTGFAAAGATFGMIAQANASPAAATAAEMFNPKGLMKEAMQKHMHNLAQPKPNMRSAADFLSDSSAGSGMRTVDILNKNLGPFRTELRDHHGQVRAGAAMEMYRMAIVLRGADAVGQVEMLGDLVDEVDLYRDDLRVVAENLRVAQELAPQARAAAKNADSLTSTIEHPIAVDQLFKAGFNVEEINEMGLNLKRFSGSVRQTFDDIDTLAADVERYEDEMYQLRGNLRDLSWSIILAPLVNGDAPREPNFQNDRQVVLDVIPYDVGQAISLREIKDRVRESGADFIPSVERVLAGLEQDGLVVASTGPKFRDGKVWNRVDSANAHRAGADGKGHVPMPGFPAWNPRTRVFQ